MQKIYCMINKYTHTDNVSVCVLNERVELIGHTAAFDNWHINTHTLTSSLLATRFTFA